MTWTCALMTSVSATVKPSNTLLSSMNFFQPQSCSFLQKRCSVSAADTCAPQQRQQQQQQQEGQKATSTWV